MQYIRVDFTSGIEVQGYQEVDDNGNVKRYTDLDGNTLTLPEVYECTAVDGSPDFPVWGIKNTVEPATNFGTTEIGTTEIPGDA
jgi:hypothetical protein